MIKRRARKLVDNLAASHAAPDSASKSTVIKLYRA